MPRDASETRERLLRAAERLFAERGVHGATSREIVAAAGQRNVSALTYHFGSRAGVLWAILRRHNEPVDAVRASLLVDPVDGMATRDLVAALLVAYADRLRTAEGRDYLRIVAQLTELFAAWREGPLSPPQLRRILSELERRVPGPPAAQRDRVVNMVLLITAAFGERARLVEGGGRPELEQEAFLSSLAEMLAAGLEAPAPAGSLSAVGSRAAGSTGRAAATPGPAAVATGRRAGEEATGRRAAEEATGRRAEPTAAGRPNRPVRPGAATHPGRRTG